MQSLWSLLRIVPKNHLSMLAGHFFAIRWPGRLRMLALSIFCRLTGADTKEAEFPLDHYPSISDFFTRKLKPGLRTVQGEVVSPIDGHLRCSGEVEDKQYMQVKGKTYSFAQLIASESGIDRFEGGAYFNLYLAPGDYHRVHVPADGQLIGFRYIPGALWPVNDWSLTTIDNLFGVNERVVLYMRASQGVYLIVLVGATNVGKIILPFSSLQTNSLRLRRPNIAYTDTSDRSLIFKAGDEIATFGLGSSVLLFFEKGLVSIDTMIKAEGSPVPVTYGSRIGSVC